jgi:YbbR domain-containing protein
MKLLSDKPGALIYTIIALLIAAVLFFTAITPNFSNPRPVYQNF